MNLQFAHKSEHFLTNIPAGHQSLIEQAATETGFPVFCKSEARDRHGHILPGYVSAWTTAIHEEHGPFWDAYRRLEEESQVAEIGKESK